MKVKELFETKERNILMSYGPQSDVHLGSFYCNINGLTSLVGAPRHVGGDMHADHNALTSLEGAPRFIDGAFWCNNNKLTSLKGIHKHIKRIRDWADFQNNPIKSHVLGLLKIEKMVRVVLDNDEVSRIINKHLDGDRDIFACQEELIEAGFPEFAQL